MEIKSSPVRKKPRLLLFIYLSVVVHLYLLLIIQQLADPLILQRLTQLDQSLAERRQDNVIIETILNSEEIPDEGFISDRPNVDSGPQGEKNYNLLNPEFAPPLKKIVDNPRDLPQSDQADTPRQQQEESQKEGDPTVSFYDPSQDIDVSMDSEGFISLATIPQDYAQYFIKMSKEISENWQHFFPVFQYYQGIIRSGEVIVNYQIDAEGNVSRIKVVKSQGYRGLNKSCVDAIQYSGNFGPLPEGLREQKTINVSFKFVYVSK